MNKQKLIELRCKAWGITEDKYYCNQCSDFSLEDMARAYRRGKNKSKAETALLSQHILDLQKDKGNLTDRVRELEQQIEKMKCCGNCKHYKPVVTVNESISNMCEDYYDGCNNNIYEPFNKWEIKEK